jgi:hypothetical protein
MISDSTNRTWRTRLTLAAVTGMASGIARAVVCWLLDRLTSP